MPQLPQAPDAGPLQAQNVSSPGSMRGFVVHNDFSGIGAPQIDVASAVKDAGSVGAIGQGLENAGGALEHIAQIRNSALNQKAALDAEAGMTTATSDIAKQVAAEHDPNKWPGMAEKLTENFRKSIIPDGLSPDARDHIEGRFNVWQAQQIGHVNLSSAQVAKDQLAHAVSANFQGLVQSGQYDQGAGFLEQNRPLLGDNGVKQGLAMIQTHKVTTADDSANSQIQVAINTGDEDKVHAAVQLGTEQAGWNPRKQRLMRDMGLAGVRKTVERQGFQTDVDTIGQIAQHQAAGAPYTPQDIDDLHADGQLSDQAAAAARQAVQQPAPATPAQVEDLITDVMRPTVGGDENTRMRDLRDHSLRVLSLNLSPDQLARYNAAAQKAAQANATDEGRADNTLLSQGRDQLRQMHQDGVFTPRDMPSSSTAALFQDSGTYAPPVTGSDGVLAARTAPQTQGIGSDQSRSTGAGGIIPPTVAGVAPGSATSSLDGSRLAQPQAQTPGQSQAQGRSQGQGQPQPQASPLTRSAPRGPWQSPQDPGQTYPLLADNLGTWFAAQKARTGRSPGPDEIRAQTGEIARSFMDQHTWQTLLPAPVPASVRDASTLSDTIPAILTRSGSGGDTTTPGYSPATVEKLQEMLPHIMKSAGVWGVDPREMLMAIGEEYDTRSGFKQVEDEAQDWMARHGMHLGISNGKGGYLGADIGPANFAVHNATELLQHYDKERDPRLILRGNSPEIPDDNVSQWLASDEGTAYATAMHLRRFHDRFDPLNDRPLTDEQRQQMAVMFFRQGNNFLDRYAKRQVQDNKGATVTRLLPDPGDPRKLTPQTVPFSEDYVRKEMLEQHQVPAFLQGRTSFNVPSSAADSSFVERYNSKDSQLKKLLRDHPGPINGR
ncbi:MAG: hypothetical protein JWO94_682 [Verrucomicrobiaceae bacterium]|nr:hypothetical protein [Verrucomicrobiaceae bacterium]